MKKYINRVLSISMLSILLIAGTNQVAKAQDVTVSYQAFYDNLAPYGQWIYDPEFGNFWVPNEDGDFRPYGSRGHWVMTEFGNTWVSDDPWGWAVYHYGRWTYNPYYGWIWVPGYEWAPAWVSWRFGGGYAGWAPLGPGINVGVSYYAPDSWWVFVGPQYMYQPNCMSYWRGPSYNTTYIRQTTIINNYYVDNSTRVRYNYGPRAEVIQRVTRQPVQVYRVSQLNRPGAPSIGRNTVSLYRPSVNRATVNDARPSRVMQAPRPVGRAQAATPMGAGRQPAFRQEVQRQPENRDGGRQQPDRGGDNRTNRDGRQDSRQQNQPDRQDNRSNRFDNRPDTRQQNQPDRQDNRRPMNQSDRQDNRQPMNQPDRQDNRRPMNQPDIQDNRQPMNQPDRQENRRPMNQPDRQDNRQPMNQPDRQENRRPMNQPERQESRPMPQPNRQESRPMPQPNRQESRPMPQPNRQESKPQMQPQPQNEGRQGGRR